MNKMELIIYFIGLVVIGLAGVIFSNKEKIKEYVSKFSSLLFMYKFNCFFITVGIVFFLLKLYVPFIYSITTVFYYEFLTHLFPVRNEKKLEQL